MAAGFEERQFGEFQVAGLLRPNSNNTAAVQRGRDRNPKKITLQTRTLRYNRMHWLEVLRLEQHWQDTRADAEVDVDGKLVIATKNVSALRLRGWEDQAAAKISIDGQQLEVPSRPPMTPPFLLVKTEDRGWTWDRATPRATRPGRSSSSSGTVAKARSTTP